MTRPRTHRRWSSNLPQLLVRAVGLVGAMVVGAFLLGAYAQGFETLDAFRTRGSDGYPFSWDGALLLAGVAGLLTAAAALTLPGGDLRIVYLGTGLSVACLGALMTLADAPGMLGWAIFLGVPLAGAALLPHLKQQFWRLTLPVPALTLTLTIAVIALATSRGTGRPLLDPAAMATAVAQLPPSPTSAPTPSPLPTPRPVRFAPGEPFDAGRGLYYLDPQTGAVEGWQLPGGSHPPDWQPPPVLVTPSGRYFVYSVPGAAQGAVATSMLYDTVTGSARVLPAPAYPAYPIPRFAPDERRYLLFDQSGFTLRRADDDAIEQAIDLTPFGYTDAAVRGVEWSPTGDALLLWYAVPPDAGPLHRVLHITLPSGTVRPVGEGLLAHTRWAPDGRQYFIATHDTVTAADAVGHGVRWQVHAADLGLTIPVKDGTQPLGSISVPFVSPDGSRAIVLAGAASDPGEPTAFHVAVIDPAQGDVQFWVEHVLSCGRRWTADGRWFHVVGGRGAEYGSFLIAADGSQVRFLGRMLTDVSPVDPRLGADHGYGVDADTIEAVDLVSGAARPLARISGEVGWDTKHDPIWLSDGRLVLHAPHPGHGGCGFYDRPGDLTIRFPP